MPENLSSRPNGCGHTVNLLIVDDDEVDQMAIQRAFRKAKIGNPLFTASDGMEALEMLRGENGHNPVPRPYIILLDLKMPRMNGLEFLEALRQDPQRKHAVVFVLTTSRDERDRYQAYDQHIAGYIVKSTVSKDFLEVIGLLDHYWKIVELPVGEGAPCLTA